MTLTFRQHCDQRLLGLENDRLTWWNHWRELAEYILPRRYRWLVTPNESQRGSPINGRILDSTGTIAARTLAAGMMSGIVSPTRPWFKLAVDGFDDEETSPVTIWLGQVEKILYKIFHDSNFYNSMAVMFGDLSVFNTATVLIYEDYEDVIRCFNPCAGEYYLANSPRMQVNVFARKFTRTVAQIVEQWGKDNSSESVKRLSERGGDALQQEIVIAHLIEPNDNNYGEVSRQFQFREMYWEWGSPQTRNIGDEPLYLEVRGFNELPGLFVRWDITSNDAYGRGPSMDALGDIKQLQQETKRKAQAIDKMVNPPLRADVQMKNQPASLIPGGVTYVTNMATSKGIEPVYTVAPPIQEIMLDIKEVQLRIQRTFHNDLFMMFQNMEAEPRSAAAVDARREEKVILVGPVLERVHNEALDIAIDRTFNIANRAGILPIPPPEIQGRALTVNYISMLAEAQKAVAVGGIERISAYAGNLAAVNPSSLDKLDIDQAIDEMGSLLNVTPKVIRSDDAVMAMREERARKEQQLEQLQQTSAAVAGAKTLSETQVGQGNALEALLQ